MQPSLAWNIDSFGYNIPRIPGVTWLDHVLFSVKTNNSQITMWLNKGRGQRSLKQDYRCFNTNWSHSLTWLRKQTPGTEKEKIYLLGRKSFLFTSVFSHCLQDLSQRTLETFYNNKSGPCVHTNFICLPNFCLHLHVLHDECLNACLYINISVFVSVLL